MAKNPGQQGGPDRGGRRPGKDNQTNNPKGPDKQAGGNIPPDAHPKGK